MADPERKVGGYALGRRIRTGPHLAVFESRDNLDREVEVACYRANALRDRTGKDAFMEEARRTASLHHENLCLLVNAGEEENVWFAVSVSPAAPSVRDLIERGGALAPERVAVIAEGGLTGLAYLHREGMRHGDLRPETVFLSSGRVILAPRPLVPYAPRERDHRYLSPEELRALGSDVRSDLHTLGLILAEALTGQALVTGATPDEAIASSAPGLPPLPAGTSPGLALLLAALLAERPEGRPADPATALRILRGEIAPAAVAPPPAPPFLPGAAPPPATAAAFPRPGVAAPPPAPPPVAAPPRREPGRLLVPAGEKTAVWELTAEPTRLSLSPDGTVRAGAGDQGAALARILREAGGDVLVVDAGADPRPRVNGSLVDRHVLVPGDRIRIGETEAVYQAAPPDPRRPAPPPRRRHGSPGLILLGAGLCLLVLGLGAVLALNAMGRGEDVVRAAEDAEARVARAGNAPAPEPGTSSGDREKARAIFEIAKDWVAKHPGDLAGARKQFEAVVRSWPGTDFGWFAEQKILEIEAAERERLAKLWEALGREAVGRIEEDRLYDAHLLYLHFGQDHPETLFSDRARQEASNLLEAIATRFGEDMDRVEAAEKARDFGVALDILGAIEAYGTPDEREKALAKKEEIRSRIQETQQPGGEPPAVPGGEPPVAPPPPPKPGPDQPPVSPGPDAPAEKKAGEILDAARIAAGRGRHDDVLRHLAALDALGATAVAKTNAAEIARLRGIARLETLGCAALFHGATKVVRGREVEITYPFDSEEEMKDWVYMNPFADIRPGSFFFTDQGIRGRGVGSAVHPGVFEPGRLEVRARVKGVDEVQDFGVQMFEPEEMVRFYLFSVQNRFFTIGARREPAHENMIWIFGGGAWADTPGADIGFVRVAGSADPKPKPGEWFPLETAKDDKQVTMSVAGKKLAGSALGDDRFVYPALQPALYVLGAEAVWDEIVVRGTLEEKWVEDRMRRLRASFEK